MSYQDIDIIVSTTLPTIDKLMEYKNGWDAILLYFRYVRQARLQKTNTTYSKDTFMAEWMWWSVNKFYKVKKILTDNNLIETVIRTWEDWKITWKYVKINFIIKEVDKSTIQSKNDTMEKPYDGKWETNAWSNKINALNNKYKYKDKEFNSKKEAIDFVYENYKDKMPKDKRKWNKSAQAKLYIDQLLKEYSVEDLVRSANSYFKTQEVTYIMATQYFYSNTKQGKQYRVFEDYVNMKEAEIPKKVSVNFNDLF